MFTSFKQAGWFKEHGWDTYIGRRPEGWNPGPYSVTRKDVGRIDPKLLVDLPGGNGEHLYFRHNDGQFESQKYPGQDWLDMVNWAKEELAKPDSNHAVMIVKDQNHRVYIHEGNHRIRAAVQAGLPDIPVEIVYWAFSEDSGLIYNPETKQFSAHGLLSAPKLASAPPTPLAESPISMCASSRLFHRVAGPDIDALVTEFLGFLDPKGQLPRPTIKIQNNAASRWLGQCGPEGLFNEQHVCVSVKATIYLQKILLDAPEDLRRVVAHEIAHYYAFAASVLGKHLQDYNEIVTQDNKEGGHGRVWQAVIQKVNATYGENFITVTSDQTYSFKAKEVNLFIMRQDNRLDWCWSTQMPERVVDFMAQMNRIGSGIACFIGKTDNKFLVVKEAKATNTAMPWCSPWAQEQVDALEAAWASQTNHFADYASGVAKGVTKQRAKTWTLVMANPYREDSPRYSAHPSHLAGWKLGRTLTEHEKDIISQLNAIGMDTRFTRINNDDTLFNTLPQVNLNDVIHNRGLVAGKLMEPEVQERLMAAWPRGERPVKQKTAALQGKLFLDMDGVLADYEQGAARAGFAPEHFKDQPGAFRNLELLPGARHAVTQLLQTWGPGRVYILSTPPHGRREEAEQEKREWLQEHFPDINPSNVILTLNKAKHGTIHDILVDDHPTWNGAAEFPGKVVAFTGPEAWNEVLGLKTASFWGADDTKFHRRQDDAQLRTVQQGLRERFNQLLNGLYVQPQGRNMTLRQFLTHNPITELFRGTDKSVRLMGNKLRADLDAFLHQNYTPAQVQQFKDTFGANVTDWIHRKIVAKQATLFVRLAVSDDVLRKRYGVNDEQLALAKAVDGGTYLEWVVKQMVGVKPKRHDLSYEEANTKTPTVRLPEDTAKLKELLALFTKLKRSPKFTGNKDINAYLPKDLFALAQEVEQAPAQLSQKDQARGRRQAAVVWSGPVETEHGAYTLEVLRPATAQGVAEIGGGPGIHLDGRTTNSTGWCTTQVDTAADYLRKGDIYIFKLDDRNYAQLHPQSGQFMDVADEEIPTVEVDGKAYVKDLAISAGMLGANLDGEGGFFAFNRETADPVLLAHVFGQEGDDLPDDIAERIESDPEALAVLITQYGYEPMEGDEAKIAGDVQGAYTYARWQITRNRKQLMGGATGSPMLQACIARLLTDHDTALAFIDDCLSPNSGMAAVALGPSKTMPEPQPWFMPVYAKIEEDPTLARRALMLSRDWITLWNHLAQQNPDIAIDTANHAGRRYKWPVLEAEILKRQDQGLALKYLHYIAPHPEDTKIMDLVWSKLPDDEDGLWLMGAYVANLLDWADRNLYKGRPIPYEHSQKFLPEVAEKAVWETKNPSLLALYAARCYQDAPAKLDAALRQIVASGQGAAADTYILKSKFARAEILEPLLLDVLVRQGSYLGHDVALYVAHNYDEKVKGARDAGQILIRELESRGVEVPPEAYRHLGIKPMNRTAAILRLARPADDLLLKRYKAEPEELEQVKAVNDGDFTEWTLKNLKKGLVRLPEDTRKLLEMFERFTKLKRSPNFTGNKDINSYTPAKLFEAVTQADPKALSQKEQNREVVRGAQVWSGTVLHPVMGNVQVTVFKITDPKEAALIAGGSSVTPDGVFQGETGWCTVDEETAAQYLETGPLWVIKAGGKNYCQIHIATDQFMDANDQDIRLGGAVPYVSDSIVSAAIRGAFIPAQEFVADNDPTNPLTVALWVEKNTVQPKSFRDPIQVPPITEEQQRLLMQSPRLMAASWLNTWGEGWPKQDMLGYFIQHKDQSRQALERYTPVGNLQHGDVNYLLQNPGDAAWFLYKSLPVRMVSPDPRAQTYLKHHRGPVDYTSPQAQQLFAVQKAALRGAPESTALAEAQGYRLKGMNDGDPFVPMVMAQFLRSSHSTNMSIARTALADWVLWLGRNGWKLPEGVPPCGLFDAQLDKLARRGFPETLRSMVMAWGRQGIPIPEALKQGILTDGQGDASVNFVKQLEQDWQESAPTTV